MREGGGGGGGGGGGAYLRDTTVLLYKLTFGYKCTLIMKNVRAPSFSMAVVSMANLPTITTALPWEGLGTCFLRN